MRTDRRQFLKALGLTGASGVLGSTGAMADHGTRAHPDAMGVLVDVTYCIGCRKCEWACSCENLKSERIIYVGAGSVKQGW